MPSDTYPQNHDFPSGQHVTGYQGQLAGTKHKFGAHQLTIHCTCGPRAHMDGARVQIVTHV